MTAHSEILRVTLTALPAIAELEPLWLALESRADASFFQSWLWIGTWLECLPTYVAATLLRVERAGSVLGLGILVPRSLSRHKVLHSRGLFLNCTGDPHLDEITIEYNGLLCARGEDSAATKAAIEYLLLENPEWDELYLEGLHRPDIVDSLPLLAGMKEKQSLINRLEQLMQEGAFKKIMADKTKKASLVEFLNSVIADIEATEKE